MSYYRTTRHANLELTTLPARPYIRRHLLSAAVTVSSSPAAEVTVRLFRREFYLALFK